MVRRGDGVVDGFDLLLFPRLPLRYALPGRLLMSFPSGCRGGFKIRPLLPAAPEPSPGGRWHLRSK